MRGRGRTRWLAAAAIAATLVLAACGPAPGPAASAGSDLRARTDYLRLLNGRSRLAFDGYLEGNAQLHADRLAAGATNCKNLWHSGEMRAWYGNFFAGENIACVFGCPADAATVVAMWLGSPGHNYLMLHRAFALTGVGVTCNGHVQMVVAHYRSP